MAAISLWRLSSMRLKDLSEDEAYALMRRTAMNEKRKLVDIARSLITAAEMLK